jgi:hypothetical protein
MKRIPKYNMIIDRDELLLLFNENDIKIVEEKKPRLFHDGYMILEKEEEYKLRYFWYR